MQNPSLLGSTVPKTRLQKVNQGLVSEFNQQYENLPKNQRFNLEPRKIVMKDLLSNPKPSTSIFLSENERFQRINYADEDRIMREQAKMKKDMQLEKHRIQALERESSKWDKMDEIQKNQQQRYKFQKEHRKTGMRNKNGLPFDPIALKYEDSQAGQQLQKIDDQALVRKFVRSNNLDSRSNCGYNVITGETRKGIDVPDKFQSEYQQRLKLKDQLYDMRPPQFQSPFTSPQINSSKAQAYNFDQQKQHGVIDSIDNMMQQQQYNQMQQYQQMTAQNQPSMEMQMSYPQNYQNFQQQPDTQPNYGQYQPQQQYGQYQAQQQYPNPNQQNDQNYQKNYQLPNY